MMMGMQVYWRIPFWLRLATIFCVTVGVGLLVDSLAKSTHHTVSVVFLAVVVVIWGLMAAAEKRHRRGQ
jgi:membrane protein YdbS with pleckstrin-like domain